MLRVFELTLKGQLRRLPHAAFFYFMIPVKQEGTDFPIAQFKDFYSNNCSIEQSSVFFPKCIWLGRDGYQMHLSVDQVKELLPILERFVEYGDIIERDA